MKNILAVACAILTLAAASCSAPLTAAAKKHASEKPPAVASTQIKVWVNTATGVYHYPGSRWYGRTKHGEYMTESAAKAAGDRPAENGQ